MARRDVVRSRKEAIESRSKPGAAARTYVNTQRASGGGVRTRVSPSRRGAYDYAGQSNPLSPNQNRAVDYLSDRGTGGAPQLDPRMGNNPQAVQGPMLPENGLFSGRGWVVGNPDEYGAPTVGPFGLPPHSPTRFGGGGNFVPTRHIDYEAGDPNVVNEIWEKQARDELSFYDTYMKAQMDRVTELMQLREAAIAEGRADVASQYNDQISALQEDIDAAAQSKIDVAAAFERYRGTVDPYLEASVDAAANIDLSGVEAMQGAEAVTQQFDSGVEAVDSILERIGAAGNEDLATHVEGQVREFQTMAEDAMREDMSNAFAIAEQGAVFAKAMAESLQQQDETMSDVERQKIEIDINKQIEQLQEQLADTKRARDKALAQVDKQIAESYGIPAYWENSDDAWNAVFSEWIGGQGLSPDEQSIVADIVASMRNSGIGDRAGASEWINEMVQSNNLSILDEALGGTLNSWLDASGPEIEGLIYQWAANPGGFKISPAVAAFFEDDVISVIQGDVDGLESASDYAKALDAWDLYREHQEKWEQYGNSSRSYGHAIADSYGFQGGGGGRRGKHYEGAELEQLFADAIQYEFRNDPEMAQAYLGQTGALAKLVALESGGWVGRLNTSGASELGIDSYDTAAALEYLESAQHGQFSAVGWPAGRDGQRHSASGLGQLNASNYKRFAAEFGGASAVGNPFAEAVAMLRYIRASYGVPSKALAYRLDPNKRGY